MKIAIFEKNLFWSSRLVKGARALGHEVSIVLPSAEWATEQFDVAIVNLGDGGYDLGSLVPELRAAGVYVVAHAGHKEKDLMELGRVYGCDKLATNSELTNKFEAVLAAKNDFAKKGETLGTQKGEAESQ